MLGRKGISNLFEKFSHLKIIVIGDVMLDSYLWGHVERISPEAPVPIVSAMNKENRLGGAANVAMNIQSLGAKPIICSIIGDDASGEELTTLMKKQKLTDAGLIKSDKRITTTKLRVIGNNAQLIRVDEEVDTNISKRESEKLYNKIESLVKKEKIDAIIFEDYDKGVIGKGLIEKVVNLSSSKGIIVTADPKRRNFSEYKGISLFKPNLKELKEGLKIDIDSNNFQEIKNAVKVLQLKQEIQIVLLTLASEGVLVSEKPSVKTQKSKYSKINSKPIFSKLIPAHKRNIADVSGAGDTVISVATLCLAAGLSSSDTAKIANLAGGLVCEHVGAVAIKKDILAESIYTDC